MIENVLVRKNLSFKLKIAVKTIISAGIVALAVILPQLVHLAYGQAGGVAHRKFFDNIRARKSNARACAASVHGSGTCGVRRCFGIVRKKNFGQWLDGFSRRAFGAGRGKKRFYVACDCVPVDNAFYARYYLGANSKRVFGNDFASGYRAVHRDGFEIHFG